MLYKDSNPKNSKKITGIRIITGELLIFCQISKNIIIFLLF
tara:strand:- start:2383 stop:2505 length:123 start_codon:yes stop_codon:yes gene_type:complete